MCTGKYHTHFVQHTKQKITTKKFYVYLAFHKMHHTNVWLKIFENAGCCLWHTIVILFVYEYSSEISVFLSNSLDLSHSRPRFYSSRLLFLRSICTVFILLNAKVQTWTIIALYVLLYIFFVSYQCCSCNFAIFLLSRSVNMCFISYSDEKTLEKLRKQLLYIIYTVHFIRNSSVPN